MALFTEHEIRTRAQAGTSIYKSASVALAEHIQESASVKQFDIFLSHSFTDQELILGIMMSLEDMGFKVYVDWIHDKNLSRDRVTPETAEVLRARMAACKCLFFATTANSSTSKWMPWELGYMDGRNNRASILPVVQQSSSAYAGQEYLGIYPYIEKGPAQGHARPRLWIHKSPSCYVIFEDWLQGKQPIQR